MPPPPGTHRKPVEETPPASGGQATSSSEAGTCSQHTSLTSGRRGERADLLCGTHVTSAAMTATVFAMCFAHPFALLGTHV